MPAYIYPQNEIIVRFGFMTFVANSIIVIGFAMISQVILCSVCAFVISRLLTKKAGNFVLLFFMGGMMVPFASIMLPQLIMYLSLIHIYFPSPVICITLISWPIGSEILLVT